jgi:hypothetical protein
MSLNYIENLSNFDIASILEKLNVPFNGCFAKDELTNKTFVDGNFIINLNNKYQNGSHWIAVIKKQGKVFAIDSFGQAPPQNIVNLCKKMNLEIFYNNVSYQDIKSNLCGYFCIALFLYIHNHKTNIFDAIQNFTDLFDDDSSKNDAILKRFVNHYWNKK